MSTGAQDTIITPTRELDTDEIPDLVDDLDFNLMDVAIDRQLKRFAERDLSGSIYFGGHKYPQMAMVTSLTRFRNLIGSLKTCVKSRKDLCQKDLSEKIRQQFRVFVPDLIPGDPRYGDADPVMITGYYTPQLEVSRTREGLFQHPIYQLPMEDWYRRQGRFDIDFKSALDGQELEIVYGKDLFNIYLLHLEGGGRVRLTDKGKKIDQYISYAGTNQKEWRFISELMIKKGWIDTPTIAAQREFIEHNPHLRAEIFSFCPSYVYFRNTDHPPEGSDRVPLTDNRSIATDRNYYPLKGTLSFVKSTRPMKSEDGTEISFSRFALDQDTGGAIKGKARVDFYFGEGDYAEHAAHNLKHRGEIYFLMPR